MPWQTVDARPQKRRTGDAVEDAERRELRLRRTYNEAAAGHAALAAKAASAPPADAGMRKACEALLKVLVEEEGRYQLGKSKVFFRAFMLEKLEQRRGAALAVSVVLIQRHARGALWRQRFLLMKRSAVKLQAAGRRAAKRHAFTKARAAAVAVGEVLEQPVRLQPEVRTPRAAREDRVSEAERELESDALAERARVPARASHVSRGGREGNGGKPG